ncbi:MAG: cytochrome C [Deltaproteobacteria bacterium]|nr:MAG: cytochrome C [Desulfobacterales bacterium]PIE73753.1 MAG: cytochrome C [Deltaproteobacteria bacterium]
MYNKGTIIPGLVIFVLIVTSPIWLNAFMTGSTVPKVELPTEPGMQCVASAEEMRANHMVLLNEWRDDVLRDGHRTTVTVGDRVFRKGLQMACMECHTSKEKFCDTCHAYASVKPYCWDCHLSPAEAATKKEIH